MKSMVFIPAVIAGCIGSAALLLWAVGVRFSPLDPINAGAITAIAAMIAILPVVRTRQTDPAAIIQLALLGTVLHLLCTAVQAGGLIALHLVNFHGPFIFWLLGAFWVSLAILVWQLRRVILEMTAILKVQN